MDMLRKTKILVIEDEEPVAMLMAHVLMHAGCDVQVAYTGKKGVELAKETKFDLITLDIGLPDVNGFEICKILKELHVSRRTPIVLVSGNFDEESVRQSGAVDFIKKPFQITNFAARLLAHLKTDN